MQAPWHTGNNDTWSTTCGTTLLHYMWHYTTTLHVALHYYTTCGTTYSCGQRPSQGWVDSWALVGVWLVYRSIINTRHNKINNLILVKGISEEKNF